MIWFLLCYSDVDTYCQRYFIKTVRAGELDCPSRSPQLQWRGKDNQRSKRVQRFDLEQVLALFLYVVSK